ncbi:21747_t:CDS:2, partial [Gigaspora rosea]
MNLTTGLLHVSNTILKRIDDLCKKYLTPNLLALQWKQIMECLLYRSEPDHCHNAGFIEDDYKEPQILLNMALEDCSGSNIIEIWEVKHIQSTTNHSQFVLLLDDTFFNIKLIPSCWYSDEGLLVFDKDQELSIWFVQSDDNQISTGTFQALEKIRRQEINNKFAVESDSKKVSYGRGLGICKKALNLAIINGTNKVLEDLLQKFIIEQISTHNNTASEQSQQGSDQENKDELSESGSKKKISINVLGVSCGIMIPEIAPQKYSCDK